MMEVVQGEGHREEDQQHHLVDGYDASGLRLSRKEMEDAETQ